MNANFTAPIKTRIAAFLSAIVASTAVLGATVLSMVPADHTGDLQVVAMQRVVVTAPAVN
jgi:hypothetical protein